MNRTKLILLSMVLAVFSVTAQIADKAEDISPLLIGEIVPNANLKAPDKSDHNVLDILRGKPTVLLVYRGGWCPFCNLHLSEIQKVQSDIVKLGYQIIPKVLIPLIICKLQIIKIN